MRVLYASNIATPFTASGPPHTPPPSQPCLAMPKSGTPKEETIMDGGAGTEERELDTANVLVSYMR